MHGAHAVHTLPWRSVCCRLRPRSCCICTLARMLTHDGTQVQRWPATEQLAQAVKRVEEEAAAGKRVDLDLAHVRAERVLLAVVWC